MDDQIRLQVYLARCNLGSRRGCEKIIRDGRVQVNGTVIRQQGVKVSPDDMVKVDGKEVFPTKKMVYLAFNKPPKVLSSNYDPEGRALAVDYFKNVFPVRLFNIGRLDYMSSGLLLFTNDGKFSDRVQHPSSEIEKEYLVETKREVTRELLMEFTKGVTVDGVKYQIKKFNLRNPKQVSLVLEEGKNREIRTLFESRNIYVKRLHRLRIGPVSVRGIAPGEFRTLTKKEIEKLSGE